MAYNYDKRHRRGNIFGRRTKGSDGDTIKYRGEDRQVHGLDKTKDSGRTLTSNSKRSDARNGADRENSTVKTGENGDVPKIAHFHRTN